MAKLCMIEREKKRMATSKRCASKRKALKEKIRDPNASMEEREAAVISLQKMPRNASPSRIQKRCRLTGRPHAVYRKFGLCRLKIREVAMRGEAPGLVKSSW
ncbi:MAG: 30S ribosomal protein S14 [Gammaproteobacteria bacterium]|nr:30S ribosomal protein S14 [Gammaproteobacteria bacterium]